MLAVALPACKAAERPVVSDSGSTAPARSTADKALASGSTRAAPPSGAAPTPAGSWALLGDASNGLVAVTEHIQIAPNGTIYGTQFHGDVFRGTASGDRFTFEKLPGAGLTNNGYSALGVNARSEPLIGCWAKGHGGNDDQQLFRFDPGKGEWIASKGLSPGRYNRGVSAFHLEKDGSILVIGGYSPSVLQSKDGGDSYALIYDFNTANKVSVGSYGHIFSMERSPTGEIIAGIEVKGFQRSLDGGVSYSPLEMPGPPSNTYGVGFTAEGEALLSRNYNVNPIRIYRRTRDGQLVKADLGLEGDDFNHRPRGGVYTILLAPWGENFISTFTAIYRSKNGGRWEKFMHGIEGTASPNAITADARCIYAAVKPGAIYRYCGG